MFPERCLLCGAALVRPLSGPVCGECLSSLPPIEGPNCPRCALPYAVGVEPGLCGPCRTGTRRFRWVRSAYLYDDGLRRLMHAFKFGGRERLGAILVRAAAERGAWPEPSAFSRYAAVVPVPLARDRFRARGFNQAERVARAIARGAGARVRGDLLVKKRGRPAQAGLSASARARNAAGAYVATLPEGIRGRDILLVDDVLTTGATASSASRALLAAGATAVDVLTLARVG